MDKVVIWARVSTDKQEYQRQVNELTDYCSRVGWNVEATFCNKISGAKSLAILFLPRYKTEGQSRVPQMARSGDCDLAIGTEAKNRLPGALRGPFVPGGPVGGAVLSASRFGNGRPFLEVADLASFMVLLGA